MALSTLALRGGQRCPLFSRSSSLWSPASRSLSTSAAWSQEGGSNHSSSGDNAVPPPAPLPPKESLSRHFRTNIHKHPMYSELPKPESQSPMKTNEAAADDYEAYTMPHLIWGQEEAEAVAVTHHKPQDKTEKAAFYIIKMLRFTFDIISGYKFGSMNEIKWVRRIICLETVAGVPGMMGAMARHLKALRRFERDYGWIHTLLEEAENERMHLLLALELRKPGKFFRLNVLLLQGIFTNIFFCAYLVSPRFCHRFVGYLEEDAVKTYTHCLAEIDSGHLKMWCKMPAPPIAIHYWQLGDEAMMRDVILAIRADEAHHRLVNHTLGGLKPNQKNPFAPGQ